MAKQEPQIMDTHTQHASTYKHEQFGSLPESNSNPRADDPMGFNVENIYNVNPGWINP